MNYLLRSGGALLAGFMNPTMFMFDHEEVETTGELIVRCSLPYLDAVKLAVSRLSAKIEANESLEFSHSLTSQLGGQTDAGFLIVGLYEDRWCDDTWLFSNRSPVCIATLEVRLP